MPTNQEIADALIRRQVDLLRYSEGLAVRMNREYSRGEPELRSMMRRRLEIIGANAGGTGSVRATQLKLIERDYRNLVEGNYDNAFKLSRDELIDVQQMESQATVELVGDGKPVGERQARSLVNQIPIVGALYAAWFATSREADTRRVMDQVRFGIFADLSPTAINRSVFGSAALRGTDGVRETTRNGFRSLARSAVNGLVTAAREVSLSVAQSVLRVEYTAVLDSRTTPICRSLDGNVYPVGEGPKPPLHPNCRSIRVPFLRGSEPPARETYPTWLGRQSAKVQDSILGPTRGALFRRGDVELTQFVDQTGKQYTLDELRERLPSAFRSANI